TVGTQRSNSAWRTGSGAIPVHLVRTRPRRNHFRPLGLGGANRLRLCKTSGSLAIFAAIRRASSLPSFNQIAALRGLLGSETIRRPSAHYFPFPCAVTATAPGSRMVRFCHVFGG